MSRTTTTTKNRRKLTPAQQEARAAEREQMAARLRDDLAAKVAALADSDEWMRFLQFAAAFHDYSINNLLLILAQHPSATRVAGFRKWQELGRQVRKGEKSIRIWGYSSKKITETDTDTGEDTEKKIPRFVILSVFAEDQTDPIDGHPHAAPESSVTRLHGDDPARLYDRTAAILTARGWSVERDLLRGEKNGATSVDGTRRVVVDARLSPAQAAKTMLHEAAHVVLHAEDADSDPADYIAHRGVWETEAESVAYVLAAMHGLDTSAYSVGYVAEWSGADPDLIATTATRVLAAVRELAAALDPESAASDAEPTSDAEQPAA